MTAGQRSDSLNSIIDVVKKVAGSAAARFYIAVWLAAVLVLALGGHDIPVAGIVVGLVLLSLSLLVTAATTLHAPRAS